MRPWPNRPRFPASSRSTSSLGEPARRHETSVRTRAGAFFPLRAWWAASATTRRSTSTGCSRIASPRLYRVGLELVRAGFPLKVVFEMGAALKADMTTVAQRFVEDFTRYIWEPAFSGEYSSAEITKLTETIQRVRPLGAE